MYSMRALEGIKRGEVEGNEVMVTIKRSPGEKMQQVRVVVVGEREHRNT